MPKKDLPAMPFYFGDWKKDPGISLLTFEEKGIWLEMLGLMWESEQRGFLVLGGQAVACEELSLMLKIEQGKLQIILKKFERIKLFSVEDGKIFSRKILKIVELSEKRAKSGGKGGKAKAKQNSSKSKAKPLANTENEIESENEIVNEFKEEFNYLKNPDFEKAFLEHMKGNKASTKTKRAIKARLKILHEYKIEAAMFALAKAIANGWQGVFPEEEKPSYNKNLSDEERSEQATRIAMEQMNAAN